MVVWRDYPGEIPDAQERHREFTRGISRPPIFVPFFWQQSRRADAEEELVRRALDEGGLFDCTPKKADKAIVFCRGYVNKNKIMQALSSRTNLKPNVMEIQVFRKMGEANDEILILLRNPYGRGDDEASDVKDAYKKEGTLERKFCEIIGSTLKYMYTNIEDLFYEGKVTQRTAEAEKDAEMERPVRLTPLSRAALDHYFFGPEGAAMFKKDSSCTTAGLAYELREAQKRLRAGEIEFFVNPLYIFKKEEKPVVEEEKITETTGVDEAKLREIVKKELMEMLRSDDCKSMIKAIIK